MLPDTISCDAASHSGTARTRGSGRSSQASPTALTTMKTARKTGQVVWASGHTTWAKAGL